MSHRYFVVALASANKAIWCCVFLAAAALGPVETSAQSLGFVTSGASTVSVRELQIPAKAKSSFERGLDRLAKHDLRASIKSFAAAIAAAPDFPEAYYHRGVAESQLGQNEEALRSFQAAMDLSDGHEPRAEFGYALVLSRIGSATEAERIVRHGLQTDPNISDGHVVLGVILLKLNRFDEAEKSAQEAILLQQPSSVKGHLILADVQGERGNFAGQAYELEEYLEHSHNDPNHKFLEQARDAARRLAAGRQHRP